MIYADEAMIVREAITHAIMESFQKHMLKATLNQSSTVTFINSQLSDTIQIIIAISWKRCTMTWGVRIHTAVGLESTLMDGYNKHIDFDNPACNFNDFIGMILAELKDKGYDIDR